MSKSKKPPRSEFHSIEEKLSQAELDGNTVQVRIWKAVLNRLRHPQHSTSSPIRRPSSRTPDDASPEDPSSPLDS